jgi:hypothetical protein
MDKKSREKKEDFAKRYKNHLEAVKKQHPNVTFLGADGSPRGERDRKKTKIVHVVTIAESPQEGFAIVGIYTELHDAQLKAAEIRSRIKSGDREPVIIGVEEYLVEQFKKQVENTPQHVIFALSSFNSTCRDRK